MEKNFFAALLVSPHQPAPDWAASLAASLQNPQFTITLWEALGRRFRRNYSWIFLTLAASWILKNMTQPTTITTWNEFLERGAIGLIGGEWVIGVLGISLLLLFAIGFATIPLRKSTGEVFDSTHLDRFIHDRTTVED